MRGQKWTTLILAIVVVLLAVPLLMSACSSTPATSTPTPTSATKAPYVFGASIALSGPGAPLGTSEENGIETAIDYINNVWGGINGHQVQCIILDDQTTPSVSVANVNTLIFTDHVIGIIGASDGDDTLAMAPILNANHIVEMTCTGVVNAAVEGNYTYEFQTAPPQILNAEANMAYLVQALHAKTIAVLHATDSYGANAIPTLTQAAQESGVQIVADESYNLTDTDMTAQWLKIEATHPDAAVLWGSGSPPAIAMKNAQALQVPFPIMGVLGEASQGFITGAGSAAEGVVIPGFIVGNDPLPRQKDFADAYYAKYNAYPTFYNSMGWDGMMLMANALQRMGGPDNVSTDQFRQAFRAEVEATSNLPLASAVYTFSPTNHNGFALSDYVYIQVQNGTFVRSSFTAQ